jgi:hypothetical protein
LFLRGREKFAVKTANGRDIYDAVWIRLFNGGRYYKVKKSETVNGIELKPVRVVNRVFVSVDKNGNETKSYYVQDVCNRPD